MTIKKSKEIHKTRKTIESWLNDSWESAFLLQAHHALICVHRRTRSPHPEARQETCRDQAGLHDGRLPNRTAQMMMMMMMMMGTRLNIHQKIRKKTGCVGSAKHSIFFIQTCSKKTFFVVLGDCLPLKLRINGGGRASQS